VADVLNRLRGPFNVSVPGQEAAIAALAEPDWVERGRRHNTLYRAWLAERLRGLGIAVPPAAANFVLADFGSPERAREADAALRARGVIVRALHGYGLGRYLRITVGTAEECTLAVEALAAWATEPAHV
jgi:histidinol-phosphate aminotransferase